jgi:hypothetical protein
MIHSGQGSLPPVTIATLCSEEVLKHLNLLDAMILLPLLSLHTGVQTDST